MESFGLRLLYCPQKLVLPKPTPLVAGGGDSMNKGIAGISLLPPHANVRAQSGGGSLGAVPGVAEVTGMVATCMARMLLEPGLKGPQAGMLLVVPLGAQSNLEQLSEVRFLFSGGAPANQTKERAKTNSS